MRNKRVLGIVVGLGVVVAIGVLGSVLFHFSHAAPVGLSLSNNQLLKDGQVFTPNGFVLKGLMYDIQPSGCKAGGEAPIFNEEFTYTTASTSPLRYTMALKQSFLNNIGGTWAGVNTFRVHMDQPDLVVRSDWTAAQVATYADQVTQSVKLMTDHGFVVILDAQDESFACGTADQLPSTMTRDAWDNLLHSAGASKIIDNPLLIMNIYNEPSASPSDAAWAEWQNGGTSPVSVSGNNGHAPVGHQQIANLIRTDGAHNIIMADGLNNAGTLAGIAHRDSSGHLVSDHLLTDSLAGNGGKGIMYDFHPLYYSAGSGNWDSRFGNYAVTTGNSADALPMIAGAWNMKSCTDGSQVQAVPFLSYLKARSIGVIVYAYDDLPEGIVKDQAGTPNAGKCPAPNQAYDLPGTVFLNYLAGFGSNNSGTPDYTSGMVVHYTFDDLSAGSTAIPDSSGHAANNGNLHNAAAPLATVNGPTGLGKALSLNHAVGSGGDTDLAHAQEIDIPDGNGSSQASLKLNNFSIASWIKITDSDTHEASWEVSEKNGSYWMNIRNNNNTVGSPSNDTNQTDAHAALRCGGIFGASADYVEVNSPANAIPTGSSAAWTHVACTYDGSYLRGYVNGSKVSQIAVSGATVTNDENLTVGGNNKPNAGGAWTTSPRHNFIGGAIDDYRLYNRALTANDISALYNSNTTTPPPPPPPPPTNGCTSGPSPATNLVSSAITSSSLNLAWTAPTNVGSGSGCMLTGYHVYRNGTLLTNVTTNSYASTGLTASTTYAYNIIPYNSFSGTTGVQLSVTTSPSSASISGDVNGDGRVNAIDLSAVISHDGQNYPAADFNHDGTVGAADLAILLAHWTW